MASYRSRLVALAAAGFFALTAAGTVAAADPSTAAEPDYAHRCDALRQAAHNNPTVGNLKEFGICEIDRREDTLDSLLAYVARSRVMTSDHKAALTPELTADKTGLAELEQTIRSDSTVAQLKADIKKIYADYRIYVLEVPKVRLVNGADAVAAVVTRLGELSTRLQGRIDAAKAAGKDVTEAQADLDAMDTAAAAAQTAAAPVAAEVLPLKPADWNHGTAQPVLSSARSSLSTARSDLATARADAKACIAALVALGF